MTKRQNDKLLAELIRIGAEAARHLSPDILEAAALYPEYLGRVLRREGMNWGEYDRHINSCAECRAFACSKNRLKKLRIQSHR